MKIFFALLLFCSFAFAQFDSISYDTKREEVLKAFDV